MNFYSDNNYEKEVSYNENGEIKSVTYYNPNSYKRRNFGVIISGFMFICMGLFMSILTIKNEINYNKKSGVFIDTTATIVDFESREHFCSTEESCSSYTEYAPILEYKINGNTYRYKYSYIREAPTLGETVDIKYNPKNYNDIILKNYIYPTMPVVCFGLLFVGVGIIAIFIGYINIKKQKNKFNNNQQKQNSVVNNISN